MKPPSLLVLAAMTLAPLAAQPGSTRSAAPRDDQSPTVPGQLVLINIAAQGMTDSFERIARQFNPAAAAAAFNPERHTQNSKPVRPGGSRSRRLGVGCIFSYLGRNAEHVDDELRTFLGLSVKYDLPVLIAMEGEYWWEGRPDLWNWWQPDRPGFDPANRENVEWMSWNSADALTIAWLNWGRQLRVLPPPNLMSPRYRAACHEQMRRLVPIVTVWWNELAPEKKHLFVGLKVGWESSIGVNKFHYPNGNALLEQPEADDPRTGIRADDIPARGVVPIGYAALTASGLRMSGAITEEDLVEVVRRHLTDLSKVAADLGVPRDRLFTHGAGWKEGELLYDAAVNEFSTPGWSFYRHARDPSADVGVQRALRKSDAPGWAAVEWLHQGPDTTEAWRASMEHTLADPRCRFLCIFNWKGIESKPAALEAIRAVVAEQ